MLPIDKVNNLNENLSKISIDDLLFTTLHEIYRIESAMQKGESFPEASPFIPWILMSLCKFSLIYNIGGEAALTEEKFVQVYNQVLELNLSFEENVLENSEYDFLPIKIFRVLALQQFWFQRKMTGWELGRQVILFKEIKCSYPVEEKFYHFTGLTIDEYLECAYMLFCAFHGKDRKYVDYDNYLSKYLAGKFPKELYDKFFFQISKSPQEFKNFLANRLRGENNLSHFDVIDLSPFIHCPLIQISTGYAAISQRLYECSIKDSIYNILKANDGNNFCQEFGKTIQEKYIQMVLDIMKMTYYTDSQLSKLCHDIEKRCDFTVPCKGSTILIESKAIQVKPALRADQRNERLQNYLKKDIVKAVVQAYATASALSKNSELLSPDQKTEFYALIVTYEELFLGPGPEVWDEFLGEHIKDKIDTSLLEKVLPPDNIFFISLDVLDDLTHLVLNHDLDLSSILKAAKTDQMEHKTLRISLDFFLRKHYPMEDYRLPHLEKAFKRISDNLARRLDFH
jgi:hypothetical protein